MIGIFGGSFDPVHLGHLELARAAYRQAGLEQVIFVPQGIPPHRELPQESPRNRLALIREAISNEPGFSVTDIELQRTSPSWTVETLASLQQQYPQSALCLILGSDAFAAIDRWRRWEELVRDYPIIVVRRKAEPFPVQGKAAGLLDVYGAGPEKFAAKPGGNRICWLETDIPDVSSTVVRACMASGDSLDGLLPDTVSRMIADNGMYGYGK